LAPAALAIWVDVLADPLRRKPFIVPILRSRVTRQPSWLSSSNFAVGVVEAAAGGSCLITICYYRLANRCAMPGTLLDLRGNAGERI
jgi:hypothetical protein